MANGWPIVDGSETDDPDADWQPIPRIFSDEEAHLYAHLVVTICRDHGYPGESRLSIPDWLKERLTPLPWRLVKPVWSRLASMRTSHDN